MSLLGWGLLAVSLPAICVLFWLIFGDVDEFYNCILGEHGEPIARRGWRLFKLLAFFLICIGGVVAQYEFLKWLASQ